MKTLISITFLLSITFCNAQQPQWELIDSTHGIINAIAVDPNNDQVIYIEDYDGLYKTTNGGATWDTIGAGLNTRPKTIIVDHYDSDILWAGGSSPRTGAIPQWMGIAKSMDGGQTWFKCDSGVSYDHHGYDVSGLEMDRDRDILYAYDHFSGLYRSIDGGNYWEIFESQFSPKDLFIDEDGAIYLASHGIWKKDLNSDWQQISNGLPGDQFGLYTVSEIAKVPGSNTLYCLTFIGDGLKRQLYKSHDDGENWFPMDLIVHEPNELVVSNQDTNTVFIASQTNTFGYYILGGVRRSTDGGNNWEIIKDGLPDSTEQISVHSFTYEKNIDNMYAYLFLVFNDSTYSEGFYSMTTNYSTNVKNKKQSVYNFLLNQNYPNPFNSNTTIKYAINNFTNVKLSIYNIQGKEVATLVNREHVPGNYSARWNGENQTKIKVAGGIYFCRLIAGSKIITRKIIYLP